MHNCIRFYKIKQNQALQGNPHVSQVLGDAVATGEDDRIKGAGVQLRQILHLHLSLAMAETRSLHHHVPTQGPEVIIYTVFCN